jgi:hypothetical protein
VGDGFAGSGEGVEFGRGESDAFGGISGRRHGQRIPATSPPRSRKLAAMKLWQIEYWDEWLAGPSLVAWLKRRSSENGQWLPIGKALHDRWRLRSAYQITLGT